MFKRYVYKEGLTTLLGSKGKYLINNDGQIKDINGNDIPFEYDQNGHKIIHCSGWDGERIYRIIDLVAIQYKSLYIPKEDYGQIIAFVIDGDYNNTHSKNIGYRFINKKLPYKEKEGFYYVPGFTSVAINTNGVIVNTLNNHIYNYTITLPIPKKNIKGGYYYVTTSWSRGHSVRLLRHRALCLTFKDYPDNVDTLVVNHKDGIPGHDILDNLEWATRGENNVHAYINDLKNQHMRVLVRNVLTGEVIEYYSISECARQLGYKTDETIRQRLYSSDFSKVFSDGTQIKLKTDTRDWIIPENPIEAIRTAMSYSGVPVKIRKCDTLEEFTCETVTEAGKITGIKSGTINYRLLHGNKEPLFGFQFKELYDQSPFPNFTKEEFINSLKPRVYNISGRNLITGEEKEFPSGLSVSKTFNIFLIPYFEKGLQPILPSGWQFKPSELEWIDVNDVNDKDYYLFKTVSARKEDTGEITIAESAAAMSKILNLYDKSIRQAALTRGHQIYKGYRFRLGISNEPWPTNN